MEISLHNTLKLDKLSHWQKALGSFAVVIATSSLAIFLSAQQSLWVWCAGQILFGINIFQWFALEHDFGHNSFFPSRRANHFFGYFASLFCLLPFAPWKFIHARHHRWTGWKNVDPTMQQTVTRPKPNQVRLANFMWRNWVPLLTLGFSFANFWNLKRLFSMCDDRKLRFEFVFSQALVLLTVLCLFSGSGIVLRYWLLAYAVFLFISDPLLISQHSHLQSQLAKPNQVAHPEANGLRPFAVSDQSQFTRSLKFPFWISRFVFLNFNEHSHHHHHPTLPCFALQHGLEKYPNSYPGMKWILDAKKVPLDILLFDDQKSSGLKI